MKRSRHHGPAVYGAESLSSTAQDQEEHMLDLKWMRPFPSTANSAGTLPKPGALGAQIVNGYSPEDFRARLRATSDLQGLQDVQALPLDKADVRVPSAIAQANWTFESWGDYLRNTVFKVLTAGAAAAGGQAFRDTILSLCKHPSLRTAGIVLPSAVALVLEQIMAERLHTRSIGGYDPHLSSRILASSFNNSVRKSIERAYPQAPVLRLSLLRCLGVGGVGALRDLYNQLHDITKELENGGSHAGDPNKLELKEILAAVLLGASVRACLELPKQIVKSLTVQPLVSNVAQNWIKTTGAYPTQMSAIQQSVTGLTVKQAMQHRNFVPIADPLPAGGTRWHGGPVLAHDPLNFTA